ncbi:pyridoxal-phosphate-dependent aminotransferase family protein [Pectobacterium carotovorum]|nr:aminotransferase class V-fold PLP-dependent enzyme [Pectobacterium carotovorum]
MLNNRNTGPTALPPAVIAAMAQQPMSHRSTAFRELFSDVTARLARLVNAVSPALLLTCSGSGGLEAGIASLVAEKSRVLVLTAGHYGDLLAKITRCYTAEVTVLTFALGGTFDRESIAQQLQSADYDVVLLTHSESATAVYHPIQQVISTVRAFSDALILLDVVSSLGATAIDMPLWGADVMVGATQKGLMTPPGLAVLFLSERARYHIERHPAPQHYLTLRPWLEAARQHAVPFTPAVNVFQGLQAALRLIEDEGELRYQRHRQAAERCRSFFSADDETACFASVAVASHSMTAFQLPAGVSAIAVKELLETAHNTTVSTGLGALSDRLIRIGHMGWFTLADVDAALAVLAQVIDEVRR